MNSLFGVELPTPVNFVIAFVVVLAADRRGHLAGAPVRRDAARRRRAQPPAAACGDRCRRGRRPAQARHHPPRQRRAPADDRRPDRRRGRNQHRARGAAARPAKRRVRANGGRDRCRARCRCPIRRHGRCSPSLRRCLPRRAPECTQARQTTARLPTRPGRPRPAIRRCAAPRTPAPPQADASLRRPLRPRSRRRARPASAPPRRQGRRRCVQLARSAAAANDQNLAEMAQRLEAALRRPVAAHGRRRAEAARPQNRARRAGAASASPKPRPPRRAPPHPAGRATETARHSIEQEMASLLGRPGKD